MKKLNQKMWCLSTNNIVFLTLLLCSYCSKSVLAIQKWTEQPRYQEVNPHGSVVMGCLIANKKGREFVNRMSCEQYKTIWLHLLYFP